MEPRPLILVACGLLLIAAFGLGALLAVFKRMIGRDTKWALIGYVAGVMSCTLLYYVYTKGINDAYLQVLQAIKDSQ